MTKKISSFLDFFPAILFFAIYFLAPSVTILGKLFEPIFLATLVLLCTTLITSTIQFFILKHFSQSQKITFFMVIVFSSLTLLFHDENFIKMKVTIINLIFASVLFAGLFSKKLFLKKIMGENLQMQEKGWQILTRNFGIFFIIVAIANEIIWRSQSTDFWVTFKTWGILPLTFLFIFTQIPIIKKYVITEE
jgi:intracellular septation protein